MSTERHTNATMTTAYPKHNPFPYQGTVSIEGARLDSAADSLRGEQPALQQPTLLLDPVLQLDTKVSQYLSRYAVGEQAMGQMVILSGDHGSGKTHSIRYVMGLIADRELSPQPADQPTTRSSEEGSPPKIDAPLQLYAKAEGPDFLTIYQQVMTSVPLPVLRQLSLRFFAVLAGEQVGVDRKDRESGRAAAEKFRLDPGKVDELFSGYSVDKGAVHERQVEEIDRVAGGIDDFKRALYYLQSDNLSLEAYNWITRQPLREDSIRKLGVSSEISSPDVAKWGLQLLAAIFRRAGRPLIIYLDQYEKLVLDNKGGFITQNAGLLHSLVEVLPRESATLVLAGNREAWAALARDLKQRFAFNVIEFSVLRPADALGIILIYLRPTSSISVSVVAEHLGAKTMGERSGTSAAQSDSALEEELYPFKLTAVREIVRLSGGNPRKLLQTCSAAFDAALRDKLPIDVDLVETVLRDSPQVYFDSERVRMTIRRMLNEKAMGFVEEFKVQDIKVDFAVLDDRKSPRMVIELTEAMFYDDEARKALEHLNLVERMRSNGWSAACAFVVMGYVSPQITETVRRFAPEYVIYNPETFEQNFEPILARVRDAIAASVKRDPEPVPTTVGEHFRTAPGPQGPPGPMGPQGAVDASTLTELNTIKAELRDLQATRSAEAEAVQEQLKLLLQTQAADRLTERRQSGRMAWAEERRKIESEMEQARQGRRRSEFDELERLAAKAEHDRKLHHRKRSLLIALAVFASAFVISTLVVLAVRGFYGDWWKFYRENWLILNLAVSLLLGSWWVLRAFELMGEPSARGVNLEIQSPVGSLRELDQLVRSPRMSWVSVYMLSHPHPHIRYAVAIRAKPEQGKFEPWIDALLAERSAIIRRAIAVKLAPALNPPSVSLEEARITELIELAPESAYLVEVWGPLALDKVRSPLASNLRTLAFLAQGGPSDALAFLSRRPDRTMADELFKAFDLGLDRHAPQALAELSASELREAARRLSPFEDGGLGTFDELRNIAHIDQLYLFFRQLQFYFDRDLIGSPQSSPAPDIDPTQLGNSSRA